MKKILYLAFSWTGIMAMWLSLRDAPQILIWLGWLVSAVALVSSTLWLGGRNS